MKFKPPVPQHLFKELLENSLYKSLIEQDTAEMLRFVRDSSNSLQNGSVRSDKLIFEREVKRHFTDYSDKATQSHVQIIAQQQLRKGETLVYSKSYEDLLNQILGVKFSDSGSYEFDNNNLMRKLVFSTKPLSVSQNGVDNVLNRVLTGQASDKEINSMIDKFYN